jgi:hypothetical protein
LTGIANPLKVHSLPQHVELSSNIRRDLNIVKGPVAKINDSLAFYAPKMLMIGQLGVISLDVT